MGRTGRAGPDGLLGTDDDTPANWTDPFVELEVPRAAFSLGGETGQVDDLRFSAWVHPDGIALAEGELAGLVDTRTLGGLVGAQDPDLVCDQIQQTVGLECRACADGAMRCLQFQFEEVFGQVTSELPTIVHRTEADIADDPACP